MIVLKRLSLNAPKNCVASRARKDLELHDNSNSGNDFGIWVLDVVKELSADMGRMMSDYIIAGWSVMLLGNGL